MTLALLLDRGSAGPSPAPADPDRDALASVVGGLAVPPGPGGFRFETLGPASWATWTASPEAGARPSADGSPRVLFDGRLDNADELACALDLPRGVASPASAARLVAAAWERWGPDAWERLLGPFAAAVYEPFRRRLTLARDPFGGRSLFFALGPDLLVVASEPAAVTRHPRVDDALDDRTLHAWCALEPAPPGATFFRAVEELAPGAVLTVTADEVRHATLPTPEPEILGLRRDRDYVEAFRERLHRAVADRLDPDSPTGVLMSGGLDSTAVAASAARRGRAHAFSWTFDHLPDADERPYVRAMAERLPVDEIPGDDAWPLCASPDDPWTTDPNGPFEGPYRELRRRAYVRAADAGCSVLLTGEYGDELFFGARRWLADWLRASGPLPALGYLLRELPGHLRQGHPLGLRSGLAELLPRRTREPAPTPRPWLREPYAATEDAAEASSSVTPRAMPFLGPDAPRPVVCERRRALPHGLELRRPFRDPRLVRFLWGVPAHLLFRPGWTKWLLRRSMKSLLPESVRLRRRPTSLLSLCAEGVLHRERERILHRLEDPRAAHRRWVDTPWLLHAFHHTLPRRVDGVEWVVLWRCLCLDLWIRRRQNVETADPTPRPLRSNTGAAG